MTVRLLLADDHRMLREGLRRAMTDHGVDVVGEAADGEEAVRLAVELQPDVVLMDVTMPVLDGIAATRRLRAEAPNIRVVMLTMHADRDVLDRAIKAGAVGYLVKDASTEEVVETVRLAASSDAVLSPGLAASMLGEAQKLDAETSSATPEADRVLTRREEEVLQLIADGLSTPEVAERLYISLKTVKNHLASIYQKFEARDRTQAVVQAVRMGIIRID